MLFRHSIILFGTLFIINDNIFGIWAGKVKYHFKEFVKKHQSDDCPLQLNNCKMVKNENKERALDCELETQKMKDINEFLMSIGMLQKTGNGWAESALMQERDIKFCEFIERDVLKPMLDPLFAKSDVSRTCPHESGTYHIKDYLPENYPDIKEGSYKLVLELAHKGIVCNKAEIIFDVEPNMDEE